MDRDDCHNQVGHLFYPPDRLVDLAMEAGQLRAELPHAKRILVKLLSQDYATVAKAIEAIESVRSQYEREYPDVTEQYDQEIEQTAQVAKTLAPVVVFEAAGLAWEASLDHFGHGRQEGARAPRRGVSRR